MSEITQETREHIAATVTDAISDAVKSAPMPTGAKRAVFFTGGGILALAGSIWAWSNNISGKIAAHDQAVSDVSDIQKRVTAIERSESARDVRDTLTDRRLERMETKMDTIIERLSRPR